MRRVAPAVALFFVAPLVAEFLLGNLPVTLLPALIVLAPMYGGGALLIREMVRRRGGGWPSILALGFAYAVLEEAFTTQTLFNPNYMKLSLHLLDSAYIPALGMGGAWTVFVLTLHVAWSVAVSIALVEALVPDRATTPWLGRLGIAIVALLFAGGVAITTAITLHGDAFMASRSQFASAALVVIACAAAGLLGPSRAREDRRGRAPSPWLVGATTLVASSLFLLVPMPWGWAAVACYLALEGVTIAALWNWSRSERWGGMHVLAAAGGAALAYGWHAFPQQPVLPASPSVDLAGNAFFLAALVATLVWAARRQRPFHG